MQRQENQKGREEGGKERHPPRQQGHHRGGEGGGEVTMISRGVEVSIAGGVEEMERENLNTCPDIVLI